MGTTFWGVGRIVGSTPADDLVWIEAQPAPYSVSEPLTKPRRFMTDDGKIWEQYRAKVLNPVIVWKKTNPR